MRNRIQRRYRAEITIDRFVGRKLVRLLSIPLLKPEHARAEIAGFRQMPGQAIGDWENGMLIVAYGRSVIRFRPECAHDALFRHFGSQEWANEVLSRAAV